MRVEFTVHGTPAPQGSKRGFVHKSTQRVVLVESSKKVKPWRDDVRNAAEAQMLLQNVVEPMTGPLLLEVEFHFLRPASHNGAHGLRPSAPKHKITYPDLSKLVRSTEDALTKLLWLDDAQVVVLRCSKRFGPTEGAWVAVEQLSD